MLVTLCLTLVVSSVIAAEKESGLPKLDDVKAVKAFIDSAEVVVIGFLENEENPGYEELLAASQKVDFVPVAICTVKEVWADFNISPGTISLFRKVDNHQENLVLAEVKSLNSDGLVNFISTNELRYITEYNQVTAVGLFNSEVKTHLVLFANRGSKEFTELKERLGALAPEFTGKFLFVLINGGLKSNFKSLNYFGLKSTDLPRVGIYDRHSDMNWLLPEGEISTERVRDFCQSFLKGELKLKHRNQHSWAKQFGGKLKDDSLWLYVLKANCVHSTSNMKQAGEEPKTEL